jgi:hypothetical protein
MECRAGQNSLIIPTTARSRFASQFTELHDGGRWVTTKFEVQQLDEIKKECSKHCLSTSNYILAYCYGARRVIKWTLSQAMHAFPSATP